MLRIIVDVNGYIVDNLFVHNVRRCCDLCDDYYYHAATWNGVDGTFGIEGVRHTRSEPWDVLVRKVKAMERGE